jgi:hypothetical protein
MCKTGLYVLVSIFYHAFHATQMAAWQRGIGKGLQLDKLLPSSREILKHELMPVPIAIAETNGSRLPHTCLHIHQMSSNPGVSNSEQEIGHI